MLLHLLYAFILCIVDMSHDQIVAIDQIVQFDQIDQIDQNDQIYLIEQNNQVTSINFRVIPKAESDFLSTEFYLRQGNLYSDFRSQPSILNDITSPPTIPLITIENTVSPTVCGNVIGDGNCLYRAVCLSISGSEVSFERIKELTVKSLETHRREFAHIDEDIVDNLIEEARTDGAWGEQSHLIALSVGLRIPIYVFNWILNPPKWETMSTLQPTCAPVEVNLSICMQCTSSLFLLPV